MISTKHSRDITNQINPLRVYAMSVSIVMIINSGDIGRGQTDPAIVRANHILDGLDTVHVGTKHADIGPVIQRLHGELSLVAARSSLLLLSYSLFCHCCFWALYSGICIQDARDTCQWGSRYVCPNHRLITR